MKAVLCTHFGGPDDLEFADLPDPHPEAGQAVVAVKAAALNFFDTLLIAGKYQVKPPFPFSPAAELAGVVEAVAADVTSVKAGDRVIAHPGHGAARQRLAVAADQLTKIPDALDFDRAAGLTVTYGTSYHALKDRAELKPGETLAVLGASGGVGLAAVELGKQMGAHVIACASSPEKLAFARERGADAVIDYAKENLRDALRERTGGKGVDVIYDPVGGAYAESALRAMAWGGRFLVIGFAAGEIPKIPLNLPLLKSCDIRGVFWGEWTRRFPEAHRANMRDLMEWTAAGKLSAHVHAVFPLAETARALEVFSSRGVMGKVLLRP
jgi:NADPH2:quinone reductase